MRILTVVRVAGGLVAGVPVARLGVIWRDIINMYMLVLNQTIASHASQRATSYADAHKYLQNETYGKVAS